MRKSHMNERGSIAIIVLLLILLLAGLGKFLYYLVSSEAMQGKGVKDEISAEYLAEAGAEKAKFELAKNSAWTGCEESLGTGRFKVSVLKAVANGREAILAVKSISMLHDQRVPFSRQLNFAYFYPPVSNSPVYQYAVFAKSKVILESGSRIEGAPVGSWGEVENNGVVSAGVFPFKREINMPDHFIWTTTAGLSMPPTKGEISRGVGLEDRLYCYVPASPSVYTIPSYRKLAGSGIIYSKYSIVIDQYASIPGKVILLTDANILVEQGARIAQSLMIAGGNIEVFEYAAIHGCLLAGGKVKLHQGASINFDPTVTHEHKTKYWYY